MRASRTETVTPNLEIAVVATEHFASSGEYRFSAAAKDFPGSFSFGATSAAAMRRCQGIALRLLEETTRPLS
jgi:predicted RNase H-like HicB family nuclease